MSATRRIDYRRELRILAVREKRFGDTALFFAGLVLLGSDQLAQVATEQQGGAVTCEINVASDPIRSAITDIRSDN